jgi:hypothetical protein
MRVVDIPVVAEMCNRVSATPGIAQSEYLELDGGFSSTSNHIVVVIVILEACPDIWGV